MRADALDRSCEQQASMRPELGRRGIWMGQVVIRGPAITLRRNHYSARGEFVVADITRLSQRTVKQQKCCQELGGALVPCSVEGKWLKRRFEFNAAENKEASGLMPGLKSS